MTWRILFALSALVLVSACSSDSNPSCEPTLPSSCGAATMFCNVSRQCQPCGAGTFNCDGINTNGCESMVACGGGGTCVPNNLGASTCAPNQYCMGQSCVACTTNTYNCDKNDGNGCESPTTCGGSTGNCVPSATASTCGGNLYCLANNCTPCPTNTYNCDKNDTNSCEMSTPCTGGNCVPSPTASTCGEYQYCAGQNCMTCAPNSYNCDKNDSNACEAPTICGSSTTPTDPPDRVNAHFSETCQDTLFQVNVTENESTCPGADLLLQITVRENNGMPPATGRTYKLLDTVMLPYTDGEAIASYYGPAGSGIIQSGTFTVNPSSGTERTGYYDMLLPNGMAVQGGFRGDTCPFDPFGCD